MSVLLRVCLALVQNKLPDYYLPKVNKTPFQGILIRSFTDTWQAPAARELFPLQPDDAGRGRVAGTHPKGKNHALGF